MKNLKELSTKYRGYLLLVLLALLVAAPLLGFKNSTIRIFCRILMYCTLAGSLNIINGYSGQMSLGHAGFSVSARIPRRSRWRVFLLQSLG